MTDDTGQHLIIRSGRTGPTWSAVPDWITWAGYTIQAQHVYKILKMHCNQQRGDGRVWPTQHVLSLMTPNVSRGDRLARYLKELATKPLEGCDPADGGVITIDYTATMPRRTIYTVHDSPPRGYTGALTLAEWYERHGPTVRCTPARGRRRTAPPVTPVTPSSGQQTPPADPDLPVTPSSGQQVTPSSGLHVAHPSGHEQDEGNQTNQPPPQTPAADPPTAADEPGGGGQPIDDDPNLDAAREILRRVTAAVPRAKLPNRSQRDTLVGRAAQALAAGWSADDLAARLGADLGGVDRVAGVLRYRLEELPDPDPPRTGAAPRGERAAWAADLDQRAEGADPDKVTALAADARQTLAGAVAAYRQKVQNGRKAPTSKEPTDYSAQREPAMTSTAGAQP